MKVVAALADSTRLPFKNAVKVVVPGAVTNANATSDNVLENVALKSPVLPMPDWKSPIGFH